MRYSIEGGNLPAVIIQLEPGETLLSEAGGRTWVRGSVTTETTSNGGIKKALERAITGEGLFMSRYIARSNAEIAFTSSFPGKIVAKELRAGESIICQKSAFLCGTADITLSVFFRKKLGAGIFGGEGFIMQKVTGPGVVFVELDGYAPEYNLAAGETIICDTGVVAMMDETCTMDIETVKGVKNIFFGGEGLFNTVITGPGKVCLQTMTVAKLAQLMAPYMINKQ